MPDICQWTDPADDTPCYLEAVTTITVPAWLGANVKVKICRKHKTQHDSVWTARRHRAGAR